MRTLACYTGIFNFKHYLIKFHCFIQKIATLLPMQMKKKVNATHLRIFITSLDLFVRLSPEYGKQVLRSL